jgi:acetylornithine deacetylase/succinyl-diaminopimelate desuccinylase-like protein
LIVALTADEESGGTHNGVEWLLKTHRNLIDSEFCLNEGGVGYSKDGRRIVNQVQVSEKATLNLLLDMRNPGGHSSMPRRDNAIYVLARAIGRIEEFEFPVTINEVTRQYFARMAQTETGQTAKDMTAVAQAKPDPAAARRLAAQPYYNALMRTTCIATRLEGGHADNALPQLARVVVNCRLLPGEDPAAVEATLKKVIREPEIEIRRRAAPKLSKPSALDAGILGPVEKVTRAIWPGAIVVPVMMTGGTDGRDLRNAGIPTYGVSGVFYEMDGVRWHGRDERIGVKEFADAEEFLYRVVKEYAGGQ